MNDDINCGLNETSVIKVKDGIIIDNTIFISNDDLNLLKKGILPRRSVETMPMNEPIKPVSMSYKQWDEKVAQSGNWTDKREEAYDSCREAHGVKMIGDIPCVGRSPTFGTMPTKEWDKIVAEAHEDINLETDNHNCINSPISKPNTVKRTLWWKIGTILSYLILIGMALWMLFQE